MPELPEVETIRKALKLRVNNTVIKDVEILYDGIIEYPTAKEFREKIINQRINDVQRYGKWLIFVLDKYYLLSHLRMEGKYFIKEEHNKIYPHEHVIFKLDNNKELRYMDTRKFGKMSLIEKEKIKEIGPIKDLGLEPWSKRLTHEYLKEKYKNNRKPIKTTLLDQSIVVGVGNIYADEILYLSKLNPLEKTMNLNDSDIDNIINNTKIVLEKAIRKGGTTIRSYSSVNGIHGLFQQELLVHSKENLPCKECKNKIIKIKVGGRGTYYCPKCQKLTQDK